ncbi:MAG: glycoside hydrolase family 9 protein [Bacteroidales bacterium]|nr:glycoside hydrolase family 9 protein [Bacteroidales bacterium]
MKARFILFALSLLTTLLVNAQNIRVNQLGFYSKSIKTAVVPNTANQVFTIKDKATAEIKYSKALPALTLNWSLSGEDFKIVDFSDFEASGTYYIECGSETSYDFTISEDMVYRNLLTWTMKAFYLFRVSSPIESEYATFNGIDYARKAGHADDKVIIHSSAATTQRPAGTIVSAPKGWYDAGDYNLYVVNAGISVFSLIHTYELHKDYFRKLNLNIPESNNSVPDIIDEIKWEFDWLLAMQDLDGGVYFKLTSKIFNGFEMPEYDKSDRYMVGKSTTSALDFAAMAAMGYRIFKDYETQFPGLADKCLVASEKAWLWAKAHPSIPYSNPDDIKTGGYGDNSFSDEFFWAASELFISTHKETYYNELNFNLTFSGPTWPMVNSLGLLSLMIHRNDLPDYANITQIESKFRGLSESLYQTYSSSPYKALISKFDWGCSGEIAARGMVLGTAYNYFKDEKYKIAATDGLNYLLGRNPTSYSMVTGFGDKTPMFIHDRRSGSDGIAQPLPGYLAGGPTTQSRNDCGASAYPSTYPAKSYIDAQCSYSTNEIAINWNAPFVALLTFVENAYKTDKTILEINLQEGWNIISTNLHPADSSIVTLFAGADVETIKTTELVWYKNQEPFLNTLSALTAGNGYLVKMNKPFTLTVTGIPAKETNFISATKTGWALAGCSFQSPRLTEDVINSNTIDIVKNFEGYWTKDSLGMLLYIKPGKGYFIHGK